MFLPDRPPVHPKQIAGFSAESTTNGPSQAVCRRLGMEDLGVREKWYEGESRIYRLGAPTR